MIYKLVPDLYHNERRRIEQFQDNVMAGRLEVSSAEVLDTKKKMKLSSMPNVHELSKEEFYYSPTDPIR